MKTLLATFILFTFSSYARAESFAEKIRSGKVKINYSKDYKKADGNFADKIRTGKIKRNYSKNYKKADKDFAGKIRKGTIKRNYSKNSKVNNSSSSQEQNEIDNSVRRGKSIRKGFWSRRRSSKTN